MTENRDLHIQRLTEARAQIPRLKAGSHSALDPAFTGWQQRVKHSLEQLFGSEHHYPKNFRMLAFWSVRVAPSIGGGLGVQLGSADGDRFLHDLARADEILHDALQELPTLPLPVHPPAVDPADRRPEIVVNVHNVLSQSTVVSQHQIEMEIESLPLDVEAKAEARRAATDLAAEVQGEQRWTVMAKSLDVLKRLGKGVYDKVALPLLLEIIKKQSGMS